jgi:hypothetical protein
MNRQGQIPRSRGGICGVILILLGLWGGLAPFVGPYFHFGFTPDATWHYDSGRLYYSIIPGGAALVGGVLVILTRNRGVGIAGGLLGTLGGAWFVAGSGFVTYVLKKSISPGITIVPAGAQPLRSYLETISLFSGLGILLLVAGAIAIGRFSMVGAKDVAMAAGTDAYYTDFPSSPAYQASTASQPDLSQYPTTTSQGAAEPFAPSQYPDTTTGHFPPPDPAG